MTEPTNDFDPDEKRVAELLLHSAKLDVPHERTKQRALDAGLGALGAQRFRQRVAIAAGTLLALAAAAVLWTKTRPEQAAPGEVSREAVPTLPAPKPVAPEAPPCPKLVVARGDAPLLDDWEAHDSVVAPLDGRGGNWTTYDDGTGKQNVPDKSPLFPTVGGGRSGSIRALHMVGGKFKDWGVTFGAELANAACYDASAYSGIEFWAKGPGVVKVGFQMLDVQDEKYGGLCKSDCYNAHRTVIELSKGWKRYRVRWDELHQLYEAGPPLAFDSRRIRFLEFGIGPEHTPYDLWIDDVSFVKR